jgi:hypothetical protein
VLAIGISGIRMYADLCSVDLLVSSFGNLRPRYTLCIDVGKLKILGVASLIGFKRVQM